jgi:hypothetical protein
VGADLAEGVSYPLPRIQEAERAALRRQLHSLYDDKSTKAAEWADPIARLCALEESAWHKKFPTGRGAPGGPLIHRARQALERLATEASAGVEAAIPQTIEDEVIAQFAR